MKNLLKTSKLGHGFVVTGAESGVNFEYIYNNRPRGSFIVGHLVDKALLSLPTTQATRRRKDDIRTAIWNEIQNNKYLGKKTRVLDLASGCARYIRELSDEHRSGDVESICIDKDLNCVRLGEDLSTKEGIPNIRFMKGDIFRLNRLVGFGLKLSWIPNVIIASGLFMYFNKEKVEEMLSEIYRFLPNEGLLVFSSYEKVVQRKLMRKTMATSTGEEWIIYCRKPEQVREILYRAGYKQIFITRDPWQMFNICSARK